MISPRDLSAASACLHRGGLVAFPTETVYGLGADALNDAAVARIFEAKGRPRFNPLIVHVGATAQARRHVVFDRRAEKLADAFWPGPLTLILPRRADCRLSLLVSAGLESCAVRVPDHPLALALLNAGALPVAAPSANRSGAISPTTAAHVRTGLGKRVDMVLDGGPCRHGLESTVLDLSTDRAVIQRPGTVTADAIAAVIGAPVSTAAATADDETAPRSPGRLLRHYAPNAALRLNARAESVSEGEVFVGFGPETAEAAINLSPTGDLRQAAAALFQTLHDLDDKGVAAIAVAPIPEQGLGIAINDRLRRAATPR